MESKQYRSGKFLITPEAYEHIQKTIPEFFSEEEFIEEKLLRTIKPNGIIVMKGWWHKFKKGDELFPLHTIQITQENKLFLIHVELDTTIRRT